MNVLLHVLKFTQNFVFQLYDRIFMIALY